MWFFFFQAEDGIRDLTVTGVQTCALPICVIGFGTADRAQLPQDHDEEVGREQRGGADATGAGRRDHALEKTRSEERRVGEEGRSRGSPGHLKKKKKKNKSPSLRCIDHLNI